MRFYKLGHNSKGENNPSYKGGRTVQTRTGYILIKKRDHPYTTKNGYVMEHRLIYEHYLKILFDEDIYIPPKIEIDHDNLDKSDNRLINLNCMNVKTHRGKHLRKDMSERICYFCGSNKTRITKDGYVNWFFHPKDKTKFMCDKCYKKRRN